MTETYAVAELHSPETSADVPENDLEAGAEALERPAWLPEKFKSAEDMAKAYAELERKQGGAKQEPAEEPEPEPEAEKPAEVTYGAAVDAVLDKAGIKPADLNAHWQQHGEISPEHFAAFEAAGYPKPLVEAYIRGIKEQAEAPAKQQAAAQSVVEQAVFEAVGGQEAYDALRNWAAEKLSDEALHAYNTAVSGTDQHIAALAVRGLMAQRAQEGGAKLVFGNSMAKAVGGYSNMEEQMRAYTKARESGDPRQMAAYEQRALRSKFT